MYNMSDSINEKELSSRRGFRNRFLLIFRKYIRMGYDSTTARYLAYRELR
jgi:hypothetical protein